MANGTVDQLNPAEPRPTKCKKQGRYYDPPTSIVLVPGVTLEREPWQDIYVGSADDLASSGLLDRKLFPGEQGRPRNAVSLRARGVEKGAAYWHMTPGYMQVFRRPDGSFRILLNVALEERERRKREFEHPEFRSVAAPVAGLEVHRYGDKLLNVYGSRAALTEAGLVPEDREFPDAADEYARVTWKSGYRRYWLARRHASGADQAAKAVRDHWWFQMVDEDARYPDDFVAICQAEFRDI